MLIAALTVAFSAFVQGASGLGFALICTPVLMLIQPGLLPVCVLVLMLPLNLYVAWRERHAINLRSAGWVSVGRLVGTFGGLALLVMLSAKAMSIFVGASTIAAAVVTWFVPTFTPGILALLLAGLITGVTETSTGIGGPPLALTMQHRPVAEMRATIAICFIFGQVISLLFLFFMGKIQSPHVQATLVLLPALFIGMWASRWIHARISARFMRIFVQVFAIVSGLGLLLKDF